MRTIVIDTNPELIRAIMDIHTPKYNKEIQCLIGHITLLGKFISRYSNKCNPFIQMLKEPEAGTEEYEKAFYNIKEY